MNADAHIPDFITARGAANAPSGRSDARSDTRNARGDGDFDALLNEPARSREAMTDPRDRGIVPGGRGGQRQRPDAPFPDPTLPPRPVEGGGHPADTGTPAPSTGGGLPPDQVTVELPETGGGLPPETVILANTGGGTPFTDTRLTAPETGGGSPFNNASIEAPVTGGGTPFETSGDPRPTTGGGLPPQNSVIPPATGGPQPAGTGTLNPVTGGGTPQQTATLDPATAGGQPPSTGAPAPATGGGLPAEQVSGPPRLATGQPAEPSGALAAQTGGDSKPAAHAKSGVETPSPLQSGQTSPAGVANAKSAATPAAQVPAAPAATPELAAAAASATPQDGGRPRAILERPAANGAAGSAAKGSAQPAANGAAAATAAPVPGQNANPAQSRPAQPAPPSQAGQVAANALQREPAAPDARPAAEPAPLPETEFESELTLQRQAADVRSADASVRANTAHGPRLPANASPALAAHIVRNFNQGQRQFEIRMDPPELGRVEVKLQVNSSDNRVHAVLSAERPETLADLQRTARELERALADAGLDLSDNGLQFELSQGGEDTADQSGPSGDGFAVYSDAAPGDAITDPSAGPMTRLYGFALSRASGIDVRI